MKKILCKDLIQGDLWKEEEDQNWVLINKMPIKNIEFPRLEIFNLVWLGEHEERMQVISKDYVADSAFLIISHAGNR